MTTEIECCVGCAVHHDPKLNLEKILGKCTCPCHSDKTWRLKRIKLKIREVKPKKIDVVEEMDRIERRESLGEAKP